MRRIVLWFASTVSVLVLLFGYHTSTSGPDVTSAQTAIVSGTTSEATSGSGATGTNTASKTVTGAVAATEWGPVEVQLTMEGHAIAQVAVVQYPNGNPKDAEINSQALPILIQETTTSQSADIDMVSGATVTSTGYIQSLQSALDQAGL